MAEGERETPPETINETKAIKESWFKAFLIKLRKRKIIETLAAFIGGGWLTYEIVHWVLVSHYHLPEKILDITIVTLIGMLLCALIWRWFSGQEKPRKFKLELVLLPLALLVTVLLDLNLLLHLKTPEPEPLPVSKWKNSIAVLPFVDISPQKDQEYFCDGMTEELINRLSNIRELRVPARTSAFMFKGKAEDIREIGRKLDVRTVLEGSIRKVGNQLRVTAQLVNIADGFHLWSDTFDRELKDVFPIQDEIALAVADKLKLTLLGEEKTKVTKRYTEDVEANILYLKGKYSYLTFTSEGIKKGIECFEQALQKDPNYSLPYSGLADIYFNIAYLGIPPKEAIPKAKAYLNKALAIDDNSGDTHASLGRIIAFYDWDWGAAEREFKRALELNPNSSIVHLDYSHFLELIPTRQEEAIIEARKARELDPLSVGIAMGTCEQLFFAGRFDDAIENSKKTIMMDPNQFYSHILLGVAYAGKSMMEEAISEFKKAYELSDGASMAAWLLANTHYRTGANAEADKLFDDLKERAKREYVPSYYFFTLYKVRGEFEQAFKRLEKACEEHDLWLPLALVWPDDAYCIRYDQRSTELLKKVGLIKSPDGTMGTFLRTVP